MEGRRLGVIGVLCCAMVAGSTAVRAEDRATGSDRIIEQKCDAESRTCGGDAESARVVTSSKVPAGLEMHMLPSDVEFIPYVVGGDESSGAVAAGDERLIYSNTMGRVAIAPGAFNLIADDLSVTAPGDCRPTRIEFDVTGLVNPEGVDGPYNVEFAVYSTCPGAVPSNVLANRFITGGFASFPDADPRRVVFNVPSNIRVPTNFWLGLKFSRANAGIIGGAPAQEGFTQDLFDFPGVACQANFGNFPDQPHGSFNIEIWGDPATCPESRVSYLRRRESGSNATNPPGGDWIVENVNLIAPSCQMVAYEVVLHGQGTYQTEFRSSCAGGQIPNTFKQQIIGVSNNQARSIRFSVDPPVNLSQNFWFAARVIQPNAGVVSPGISPGIGQSDGTLLLDTGSGSCQAPSESIQAQFGLSLTVICAGAAQTGACCDMYVKECQGGPSDGLGCQTNSGCASPGTCEVPCRQLARANCTFPLPGQDLQPIWEAGDACDPNPFPGNIPCGRSACCHLNAQGLDACLNRTENECAAIPPLEPLRQWQRGRYCGLAGQICPLNACLGRSGDCKTPHPTPGCQDPTCCSAVCRDHDDWCCLVEWDDLCASFAIAIPQCTGRPSNDECSGTRPDTGAMTVIVNNNDPPFVISDGTTATANETDPTVCCHTGEPLACLGGNNPGFECQSSFDCTGGGICGPRPPRALATVWYKFVATHTSARVTTCDSSPPATDSVLMVFDSVDPTSNATACASLYPIGCSDDFPCLVSNKNSQVCVSGLTIGRTYYVMVGAKTPATRQTYRFRVESPCTPPAGPPANDWCGSATPIADGDTAFNLAPASLNCPADDCAPQTQNDLWYNYTATCTGIGRVNNCDNNPGTGTEPDINLTVYQGCNSCPPYSPTLDCQQDSPTVCGPGSLGAAVEFNTIVDRCYKIRVGDQAGNAPSGTLKVSCENVCDQGSITFLDPPLGVVDAGRPNSPSSFSPVLGIREIRVQGPPGVELLGCWRINCETVHQGGIPNSIEEVVESPPGSGIYVVRLSRPITPGAFTSVRYVGNPEADNSSIIRMTSHPANVNGDIGMLADDVQCLAQALSESPSCFPPHGLYSVDIDRSGRFGPLDILDAVDLANGAAFYEPWLDTQIPPSSPCLPQN